MNNEMKNKIFIATFLNNENENLNELLRKLRSKNEKGIRILPIEQIHITWKFIGFIESDKNERIFETINELSDIVKDCDLIFDTLEIWPNLRNPRLIALVSKNFDAKFKKYFDNLEDSLYKQLKIKKGKSKFKPHITIARLKNNKNREILKELNFEPIKFHINDINVMQSIATKDGVTYKLLY